MFPQIKNSHMPLSFQGFGSMAILAMVLILAIGQGISYLRTHHQRH